MTEKLLGILAGLFVLSPLLAHFAAYYWSKRYLDWVSKNEGIMG